MATEGLDPYATQAGSQPAPENIEREFDPNDYLWEKHLKKALEELPEKQREIDLRWCYYNGDHPRVWLNEKTRDALKDINENFVENWCEAVIDKPLHRLEVTGWLPQKEAVKEGLEASDPQGAALTDESMTEAFKHNDLEIGQSDIYRQVRIAGECFLIVWPDEENESGYDISINDARWVYWPKGRHRNKPEYVVLLHTDDDFEDGIDRWRATIYYSEVVIRLIGPKVSPGVLPSSVRYFNPDDIDPGGPHGMPHNPVVRFALRKERVSVLDSIIPLQDQINKLKCNKMVVAEWLAWPMIALMTEQAFTEGQQRVRPNRFMVLHPGGGEDNVAPTSIWQSTAADLSNFDDSIEKEIQKIFTLSALPRHIMVDDGSPISGDGIEADEGPFTEMLEDHHRSLGGSWVDVGELMGLEIKPQWRSVMVRSDKSEAETVNTFVTAGVKLPEALQKYAGWTLQEVMEMFERDATIDEAASVIRTVGNSIALGADPEAGNAVTAKLKGKAGEQVATVPNEQTA